jgi:hypothetical protein
LVQIQPPETNFNIAFLFRLSVFLCLTTIGKINPYSITFTLPL